MDQAIKTLFREITLATPPVEFSVISNYPAGGVTIHFWKKGIELTLTVKEWHNLKGFLKNTLVQKRFAKDNQSLADFDINHNETFYFSLKHKSKIDEILSKTGLDNEDFMREERRRQKRHAKNDVFDQITKDIVLHFNNVSIHLDRIAFERFREECLKREFKQVTD